ncbi:MAG: hypothetical protein GY814_10115 [Gammaproteobacteria bacterium]|nr:hypothetical protein [Gammaproteobacteria bacterium]
MIGILLLSLCAPLAAAEMPDIQLYRSPKPLPQESGDLGLSCSDLDREIARLSPYTYNYRPDFDRDPYVGTSLLVSTSVSWPAYAFFGLRYVGNFQADKRMQSASVRIESLRRLKQEKFCYEHRG